MGKSESPLEMPSPHAASKCSMPTYSRMTEYGHVLLTGCDVAGSRYLGGPGGLTTRTHPRGAPLSRACTRSPASCPGTSTAPSAPPVCAAPARSAASPALGSSLVCLPLMCRAAWTLRERCRCMMQHSWWLWGSPGSCGLPQSDLQHPPQACARLASVLAADRVR